MRTRSRPALLAIVPPYSTNCAPAGAASLLGYLEANGCTDFAFLDLRLGVPDVHAPTYANTGVFAESYVMDIPDLPLVLDLLTAFESGGALRPDGPLLDRYCLERAISPETLRDYLACLDRYLEATLAQLPAIDFVGFSAWTSNFLATLLACARLKRRRRPPTIVVGGPQVTQSRASAELGLRTRLFDAVALGEGEQTLLTAYEAFDTGGRTSVSPAPGLLTLDASGRVRTEDRPLLKLDGLPLPSFDDMHLQQYQDDSHLAIPFQLSRGCTDRCTFCSEWVFWQRYRAAPAASAVESICELQRRYGADYVLFSDSLLNGSPRILFQFADEVRRRRLRLSWSGFMRAQMDDEGARALRAAGCESVFVGVESFSDETLERMNKRRTELDNVRAIRAFLEAGIGVTAGLIPGFPGDTRDAFVHSVRTLRELQREFPARLAVNEEPFSIAPGQPLASDLASAGLEAKPWDPAYLDLAPRFADVTSKLWCSVTGAAQGVERSGRLLMAASLASTTARADRFFEYEGSDESVSSGAFDYEHLVDGWHLVRTKAPAGHVYGLLLSQAELEELEELVPESGAVLGSRKVVSFLSAAERRHVKTIPRRRMPIVWTTTVRHVTDRHRVALSPFVVARRLGWQRRRRLLIANVHRDAWSLRSALESDVLAFVRTKPRSLGALRRFASERHPGARPSRLGTLVDTLVADGFLVVVRHEGRGRPHPEPTGGVP